MHGNLCPRPNLASFQVNLQINQIKLDCSNLDALHEFIFKVILFY
jgi:hypothetical protein